MLGDRWIGAIEIFSILAIAGFIQCVASLRTTVIMSSGHGSRLFKWGLCNAIVTILGFMCGLPWGPKGIAISYCISNYLILHPSLVYAFRDTPIRVRDFYSSVSKPFLASIVVCIVYMFTLGTMKQISDVYMLALSLPFCIFIYITVFCLLPGSRQNLRDYWAYIIIMLPQIKKFSLKI
jgi:PST family polysaccharide transporter